MEETERGEKGSVCERVGRERAERERGRGEEEMERVERGRRFESTR